MNKVILIGRLTKDVEMSSKGDLSIAKFGLAVKRRIVKEDGNNADFIDVVIFGKAADNCCKYLSKGSLTGVSGRIEINSYKDKDGIQRKSIQVIADEVEFLSSNQEKKTEPQGSGIDDFKF